MLNLSKSLVVPMQFNVSIFIPLVSVLGYAAVRGAFTAGSGLAVPIGVYVNPGFPAGIDEGCDCGGVRRVRWRVGFIQYDLKFYFSHRVLWTISCMTKLVFFCQCIFFRANL